MVSSEYAQIISASVMANALTLWCAYSVFRLNQIERSGERFSGRHFVLFLGAAIPPIAAGGFAIMVQH